MKLFELFATLSLNIKEFVQGVNKAGKQAQGLASTVQSRVSAATVALGNLTAMGISKVAQTAVSMTKQSLDVVKEFEQNLGGSQAVWGEWANNIQSISTKAFKTMGLSASDYLATANQMGSLFKGAGFTTGEAMDMTTKAMQRAADVASIMGVDAEWAMESIAGLAKGNFTMMDNLGVAINDTTLANYALEKGIKKSTSAMSTQEKVALALELFMERTADYAGNYAKENTTLAGSYEVVAAAYENMLIGQEGATDDFVDALEIAARATFRNLGEIVPRLGNSMWQALRKAAPKVKAAFIKLWNEEIPTLATNAANNIITTINKVFSTNIPTISNIDFPTWEDIVGSVTAWWHNVSGKISEVVSGVTITTASLFPDKSAMNDIITSAWTNVKSFGKDILDLIYNVADWIASNKDAMALIITVLAYAAVFAHPFIATIALIAFGWDYIKSAVKIAWDAIVGFFAETIPEKWNSMIQTVVSWWDSIKTRINEAIADLTNFFSMSNIKEIFIKFTTITSAGGDLNDVVNQPYLFDFDTGEYYANPNYRPFRVGLNSVPYDNFPALLHEGEAVLTKNDATAWRRGENNTVQNIDYGRMADILISALSNVSVKMDGVTVGHLTAPTVSKDIAQNTKSRRYSR